VAYIAQQAQRLRTSGHHLHLDDTSGLTINQLRAKCVQLHAQRPLSIILIDYIQLMHGETNKYTSREREVSSISQGLKELAKELNVPIIALAQLSRDVDRRGGDRRPIPSDLRESGSLEQDADCIMFLWRGEVYKIAEYADGTPTADTMLLDIAKHRNGAVDHIVAACDLKHSRLRDLSAW
jgi:replicative DNA helicase